jgi:glycosyltransferase involved in cell wall biosynthesis
MKIGIDITPLPPRPVGAGNYMIQLVRALASLQTTHQFVIFSQRSGKELIGELASRNIKWAIVPDLSPGLRLIWEQVMLPGLVRKSEVDLLHSLHYTRPGNLSCASVVTFHDMTFFLYPQLHTRLKRLFFPWAIRMSSRRADALIAVSESTRRDAIGILDIPYERIITVPSGVNKEFRPIDDLDLLNKCRAKYHLPQEFFLFVGLIEPRKNLPLLLRSYANLAGKGNYPPMVLAGRSGWRFQEIFNLIDRLHLKGKVLFTGYIPAEDLPLVYNLARIFVYPSFYEGFGFPPLEAMACGVPVITTAVSAMLDYVGDAGILVPPNDEHALARALENLYSEIPLQQRLIQVGPQRAAEFTWERTARETMKVYEKVA